ncbi:Helix-turn-helix domain-containing protein [Amycolatopsis xylanica]|uniref:Helix-turn-helix domain-containing protein n=1 Tax=Amycolatopsis xylanica TaxID=589385 RepID=A0A1H2UF31_9PSEU|nr:AraC family transcriptional regulator [Amycolatopsis xylanica]SDW54736.1 Helix-turn-helix domain-containing protein [Amycolatopsis xylanica]
MSYAERAPARALTRHVECLWAQRALGPLDQRVVPDGCVDLLWWDGSLQVAGPDTAWRTVSLTPGSSIAGIRFRPGAGSLLFGGVPLDEARDQELSLADLWGGPAARSLCTRLADAPDPARVLEQAFVDRLPDSGELDPIASAAARALNSPEALPVATLADRFGVSPRQLRRRVTAAVGYGPKTLEGVLRLRRALRLLESGGPAAEVAAVAGYADQPHLTREMHRLAGVTPASVVSGVTG